MESSRPPSVADRPDNDMEKAVDATATVPDEPGLEEERAMRGFRVRLTPMWPQIG